MSVFKNEVQLRSSQFTREVAAGIANDAVDAIENQTFHWKPLSEKYLKWKKSQGLDERILVATEEYKNSISWGEVGNKVWAGISPGAEHESSGLPMSILARIHEFGTKTIPARPLWRPLLSKYTRKSPQFTERYRKAVIDAARKARKKNDRSISTI